MMQSSVDAPAWFLPVFPFLFVLMWMFVLNLTSFVSGWRSLARSYPTIGSDQGRTFSLRSARLGFANYGSCVRFVSGPAGLSISVLFVFRPGHAPIFVPWSEVSARLVKGWLFRYTDFYFAKHPATRLRVSRGLGEQLLAAGGNVVRPGESS